MSFFDDASLVMIPSGYKDQKVYSVKPTDGTGDLTFSRASSATRVASSGLIEKVRTNLLTYSNTFSNAIDWARNASSVVSGQAGYDGTTNAWSLVEDATTANHRLVSVPSVSGLSTISVYAKAGARSFLYLRGVQSAAPVVGWFNLSTGTVGTVQANGTGKIESVGNGWYRCSLSIANFESGFEVYIGLSNADNVTSYAGNGTGNILIQNAQVEVGDVATDYIATTTAAVSVGPVSGLPRLDYLGSTCPRLILEPQRQNELQFSEQANNAYWTLFGATISANTTATLDPAGYFGADKLQEDTSTAGHTYGVSISGGSTTKTLSVFAKAAERNWAALRLYNGSSSFFAYFNLSTGALGSVTAGATSAITSYGNGWYRCSITLALGAGSCEPNIFATTGNGTISYQGVTGSGIYVYGAQLEAGAYATSYIPTLGASVTRVADIASKTSISSLIGQTEGTLFAEFTRLNVGNAVVIFQCNDGTTNNRAQLEIGATGIATTSVLSGGAVSCVITGATLALGQTHKLALTYKANDFKLYVNGVLAGTDTSGAVPISMSRIDLASELGTSFGGVSISQILNFTTALNNAQAIELTA